jgi:hypothetical protein
LDFFYPAALRETFSPVNLFWLGSASVRDGDDDEKFAPVMENLIMRNCFLGFLRQKK